MATAFILLQLAIVLVLIFLGARVDGIARASMGACLTGGVDSARHQFWACFKKY